jgi:protocatechuate 3,4-dioxygenase beta subunit
VLRRHLAAALLAATLGALAPPALSPAASPACPPTREDMLGPFYEPNAPVRSSVGKGHVLGGTVRSSGDCRPIPGARVELWLTGPNGYDDAHRATVLADGEGRYRFESEVPAPYERRPPHIHVRVSHPGFRTLVTQHYVRPGDTAATFELVLRPER